MGAPPPPGVSRGCGRRPSRGRRLRKSPFPQGTPLEPRGACPGPRGGVTRPRPAWPWRSLTVTFRGQSLEQRPLRTVGREGRQLVSTGAASAEFTVNSCRPPATVPPPPIDTLLGPHLSGPEAAGCRLCALPRQLKSLHRAAGDAEPTASAGCVCSGRRRSGRVPGTRALRKDRSAQTGTLPAPAAHVGVAASVFTADAAGANGGVSALHSHSSPRRAGRFSWDSDQFSRLLFRLLVVFLGGCWLSLRLTPGSH